MKRRKSLIGVGLVLAALPLATSGCTQNDAQGSECAAAFDQLPELDQMNGMFVVVSDALAGTLNHCSDIAEWEAELQEHPGSVGADKVDPGDLHAYLTGSCNLLPDSGEGNSLCDEGRREGLFK